MKDKEKKGSQDQLLKTVLRKFRDTIKAQFRSRYESVYFHKNKEIHRKYDKFVFTEPEQNNGFGVSIEIFEEYKGIFETILYGHQNVD